MSLFPTISDTLIGAVLGFIGVLFAVNTARGKNRVDLISTLYQQAEEMDKRLDTVGERLQQARLDHLACEAERNEVQAQLSTALRRIAHLEEDNNNLLIRVQTLAERLTNIEREHPEIPRALGWTS